MPTYNFRDIETGEVTEVMMKISELDEFKQKNPHLQQFLTKAPGLSSDGGGGGLKIDNGFNDVLNRIKAGSGRGNTINTK
jgi:hypothetical protein